MEWLFFSKHKPLGSHGLQLGISKCTTVLHGLHCSVKVIPKPQISGAGCKQETAINTMSKAFGFPYLIHRKYNYPQRQEMKETW